MSEKHHHHKKKADSPKQKEAKPGSRKNGSDVAMTGCAALVTSWLGGALTATWKTVIPGAVSIDQDKIALSDDIDKHEREALEFALQAKRYFEQKDMPKAIEYTKYEKNAHAEAAKSRQLLSDLITIEIKKKAQEEDVKRLAIAKRAAGSIKRVQAVGDSEDADILSEVHSDVSDLLTVNLTDPIQNTGELSAADQQIADELAALYGPKEPVPVANDQKVPVIEDPDIAAQLPDIPRKIVMQPTPSGSGKKKADDKSGASAQQAE